MRIPGGKPRRGGRSGYAAGQPLHHNHRMPLTRCASMMAAPPRDWSVFKPRFAEHWEAFQHAHPRDQPSSSDGLVAQRLRGGAPDQMGESAIAMAAVRGGHPSRGHAWSIVAVLTRRQRLWRSLGQPGQQGPPREEHLSAEHPDRPRHVAHHLRAKRRSLVACVHAMWRHVCG